MYYQPFSTTDLLNWEVQYSLLLGQTPSDGRDDRVSVPDTPALIKLPSSNRSDRDFSCWSPLGCLEQAIILP